MAIARTCQLSIASLQAAQAARDVCDLIVDQPAHDRCAHRSEIAISAAIVAAEQCDPLPPSPAPVPAEA